MQLLPLFPLSSLAVPGLLLPLRVFEPRYRRLVADLAERPEPEQVFGVVGIKLGAEAGSDRPELYSVGTQVWVRTVKELADGTIALASVGTCRFRLHDIIDDSSAPYLRGQVSYLDDPAPAAEPDQETVVAALRLRAGLLRYTQVLGIEAEDLPTDPQVLSYLAVVSSPLPLHDRQELLEIRDTAQRLSRAAELLARERSLLKYLSAAPAQRAWDPGTLN